ncbi:GTP-binding protein [Candidatus Micrarchaeota archaeon CG10_big_fil_rev_8_21_14_0_10_45_29]|nr:MAG: GTP-binding protein [Candidatus Micrarchaeota archaeon CG10_big_fil_rev_8_21_14_0_10_45_29]
MVWKSIISFLKKLLFRKKNVKLGFYGSTNVGKTTLANRMAVDLVGDAVGSVSPVPHETRAVISKEQVELRTGGYSLVMNILDMPGIAVKVDYRDFMEYGLGKKEAQTRAKEATRGIVEAIKYLEDVDAALVVVDSTEDPYNQINITLLGNLEAKNIPFVIVANKIDLPGANTKRVREVFPHYPVVEVSAATGENMENLYDELAIHLL